MKLTAQVKLITTKEQFLALKDTVLIANNVCNEISEFAFLNDQFNQFGLQKALYYSVKEKYGLSAQIVVRCIGKVAQSYADKSARETKHVFSRYGAIPYDNRILSYKTNKRFVSIWTVNGRQKISYQCGERQAVLLEHQQGESDLVFHRGEFYLLATCEVPEEPEDKVDEYLGVDRGVVNVATDSDGNIYQGKHVEKLRKKREKYRSSLTKRNTRSAHRRLKKFGNKQARFQKNENHRIAKKLVLHAKRTKRGIALENLKGINLRTRVRRENRAERGNWSFYQLGSFVEYKAKLYAVPYKEIDPHYTSQMCNVCGHIEKANRASQSEFFCCQCGHQDHADVNAAKNISWVAVNQPIVSPNPSRG